MKQAYSLQRFGGRPRTSASRLAGISQAVGLEMIIVFRRLTFGGGGVYPFLYEELRSKMRKKFSFAFS